MKTNKIIDKIDFEYLCSNENVSIQPTKMYYISVGTCGLTITRTKDLFEKHLNSFREYDYNKFCELMDSLEWTK